MNAVLVKMDRFKTTRSGSSERESSMKGIQTITVKLAKQFMNHLKERRLRITALILGITIPTEPCRD